MTALFTDLGLKKYQQVYDLQLDLVQRRYEGVLEQDVFVACEHYPIYTLGKNADRSNLHVSDSFLKEKQIATLQVERGGEVTYHGPGQLVLYPIISLRKRKIRVTEYVEMLEEIMVRLASLYGVTACRNNRNAGVWRGDGTAKIGSIGIGVRHGVAFHGLAININPDLEPFSWITPCGLSGVSATSLVKESNKPIDMAGAMVALQDIIEDLFGALEQVHPETLVLK